MTTSFWLDQPREGFAHVCVLHFGVTFDTPDAFMVRSEFLPVTPKKQPVAQVITKAHRARSTGSLRMSNTQRSQRAMDHGGDLISGGR